jgi:glutamate-1-semialdehyde 2,1-aminomutase
MSPRARKARCGHSDRVLPQRHRMGERSNHIQRAAAHVIPGGVNSPVRSWKAVGGSPVVIARGVGCRVIDVDGREYVDLVGSWGPLVLGHAHPDVVAAIGRQTALGTSFGAPTEAELQLAEAIVARIPSVEQVRLVSSGTEATMTALRLARAATGRDAIVKFAGCYHGHVDALLVRAGSGALTLGVPDSPGVPSALAALTWIAEFNDVAGVRELLRDRGREVAAVIVEPVAGNMGVVPPEPGFLEMLREETERAGIVLIFDEVMTGFRVAAGGAQQRFGITPDLTCLGKIVGGGMPLAAFGGRRDLMQQLAPAGAVYQAGTLSGNPLSVAAGLATLRRLDDTPDAYGVLERLGEAAAAGLTRALADTGVAGVVNRCGSMLTLFLGTEGPVRDFQSATKADAALFGRFFAGMLAEGYYLPPSQYEAMFLSLAMTEAEVEGLGDAARRTLAALA